MCSSTNSLCGLRDLSKCHDASRNFTRSFPSDSDARTYGVLCVGR